MAFTTYADYVADLAALTVTGVVRSYDHLPEQIETADLPALYVRLPAGENQTVTLTALGGLRQATCEIVIVVEPVQQNQNEPNFEACIGFLDALESALTTNALTIGIDQWSMRVEVDYVGDTAYWLLIASVQGSGS